ncbi:MAG: outer membrane protein assembly factor BamE [Bdellovibrionaceae bacterium]|nr:outer membrane protein assembly factor BamE [Pseudobdellovibrionaceae bacterium]MBX3034545.1 outer membrane protein assembly factor BamE [Pseudobdellovibrionaceae bacterium]
MFGRFIFLAATLLGLTACQSSMLRSFEKLHPGMDKHQVLQVMGSPDTSMRMHGKDRWIYRFYEDNIRFEKEVHFQDGAAVYVGNAWVPQAERSAIAVDQKNQEINVAAEQEQVERKKQNAVLFEQYEKQSKGQDKVRYMPDFKELK